jgi:hypothetical protein
MNIYPKAPKRIQCFVVLDIGSSWLLTPGEREYCTDLGPENEKSLECELFASTDMKRLDVTV